MHKLGPYSRPETLSKRDGRTREARFLDSIRASLVGHLGGRPSATQSLLIQRAAQLTLRIDLLDRKMAENHELTDHDARTYLAWTASLSRLLRALGMKGAEQRGASLHDYLASSRTDPPPPSKQRGGRVSAACTHAQAPPE
jgi:hypothetical protein